MRWLRNLVIRNGGDKCCTDGIVCMCNVRTCTCTCSGCWCGG